MTITTPNAFLQLGYSMISTTKPNHTKNVERMFRSYFGASPLVVSKCWNMMSSGDCDGYFDLNFEPMHLLSSHKTGDQDEESIRSWSSWTFSYDFNHQRMWCPVHRHWSWFQVTSSSSSLCAIDAYISHKYTMHSPSVQETLMAYVFLVHQMNQMILIPSCRIDILTFPRSRLSSILIWCYWTTTINNIGRCRNQSCCNWDRWRRQLRLWDIWICYAKVGLCWRWCCFPTQQLKMRIR